MWTRVWTNAFSSCTSLASATCRSWRASSFLSLRTSAPDLVSLPFSQQQFSGFGRQFEGEFKDFSIHRQAQDEFLLCLPSSQPLVIGIEEHPPARLRIPAVQMPRAETVPAEELDQFAHRFLIVL